MVNISNQSNPGSNYRFIFACLAYVFMFVGGVILSPLAVLPFYPQDVSYAYCFIIPGVCSLFFGYVLKTFMGRQASSNYHNVLKKNQDSIIVLSTWIIAVLLSACVLTMTGQYTFSQAVFECTSGYTTTGFTVTDFEHCPHIVLMFRSIMHLTGGVGLILILTAIMSNLYGMSIYSAEGHNDRMEPSLMHSARTILAIYLGYIAIGSVAYVLCGMDVFDSINHSIGAVATGGFSTRADNLAFYQNKPEYNIVGIEFVSIVLMLLGGTNFYASLLLLKGRFKDFFRHCENKVVIAMMVFFIPVFTIILYQGKYCPTVASSAMNAAFHVVSAFSTTGYTTVNNFMQYAPACFIPMIIMMIIGGATNSTAGGIKQYRAAVLAKSLFWNVKRKIVPDRFSYSVKINRFGKNVELTQDETDEVYAYVMIHILVLFAGTFGLTLCGYSFEDSMFEFSSALGTIGMSIGITTRQMGAPALWIQTVGMLIARLEVYIMLLAPIRFSMDIGELASNRHKKMKRLAEQKKELEK